MKRLAFLLAMMCVSPALLAKNLLVNGDWETGDTTGWGIRFNQANVLTAATENPAPHGGNFYGKETGRTATWHGVVQSANMLTILERGTTYPYSAWVRTNSASPVSVALTMQSNPGGNARYTNISTVQVDNTAWVHMQGEYTFPTEADDNGTTFTFYFEVPGSATADLYIDDVVLGTLGPVNAPYDPDPQPYITAGKTVGTPFTTDNVNFSIKDVVLNFKAGVDPVTKTGIDPAIVKHYIYMSKSPTDPNMYKVAELPQTSTTDPLQSLTLANVTPNPVVLQPGGKYTWQVKEILKGLNGVTFADDDPNNILGEPWEFTTTSPVPIIFSISDHMLIDASNPVSYTIDVSPTGTHFRWFKVVGAVDSAENGEKNDVKLTDAGLYSGTTTKTLTITGASMTGSDDGMYYAIAYNGDPSLITSSISLPSPVRKLWAPLLKSHFTFENLTGGVTADSVGGFNATLSKITPEGGTPVADAVLVAGVPELTGNALSFGGNTGTSSTSGNYAAMAPGVVDYKDITISAWVYWNGGSAWQRIIDCGINTDNYIFLSPGNATTADGGTGGNCVFAVKQGGTEASINTPALPVGAWTHVAATLSGDTARLYINGEFKSKGTITYNPINFASSKNYIGDSQWDGDPFFNGIIDDLKIYNYARTTTQIAQDYLALKGEWICNNEDNNMKYDFNKDCKTDILDMAEFAAGWLENFRIYPQ